MHETAHKCQRFRPSPGHLVAVLLVAECLLWLSACLGWPKWRTGYAVLYDMALVGTGLTALLLWWLIAVVFRWRFQFSVRSLLALAVVVAIPCSWFTSEIRRAKRQRTVVASLLQATASVNYDIVPHGYLFGPDSEEVDLRLLEQIDDYKIPFEPDWVFEKLGADYCFRVQKVSLGVVYPVADVKVGYSGGPAYGLGSDELLRQIAESLPDIQWLEAAGSQVTDAGMCSIRALSRLRSLSLERSAITDVGLEELCGLTKLEELDVSLTSVTDQGVKKFQTSHPNCKVIR
jgi:hypothetical protein